MRDLGYRSIEIVIVNDTKEDLVFQSVGVTPDVGNWKMMRSLLMVGH